MQVSFKTFPIFQAWEIDLPDFSRPAFVCIFSIIYKYNNLHESALEKVMASCVGPGFGVFLSVRKATMDSINLPWHLDLHKIGYLFVLRIPFSVPTQVYEGEGFRCVFLTKFLEVLTFETQKLAHKKWTSIDTLEIEMIRITRHVILRWHSRRSCKCKLTFIFVFENVSWHFRFEVQCQMRFVKYTHWRGGGNIIICNIKIVCMLFKVVHMSTCW